MHREFPLGGLAAIAAALVVAVACHATDASAPQRMPGASRAAMDPNAHRADSDWRPDDTRANDSPAKPVACARHDAVAVSGTFGPSGGTLVVGASRLLIPGGALRDTVTITATILGDTTSTVHFRPEGLRFRKPAGLVLSAMGCSLPREGTPSIVYLGARGEVLETIDGLYYPRFKTVAAPIEHFSGYAIAFREE